jgi:hypothetical protein
MHGPDLCMGLNIRLEGDRPQRQRHVGAQHISRTRKCREANRIFLACCARATYNFGEFAWLNLLFFFGRSLFKKFLLASAALVVWCAPGFAADLPMKAPEYVPPPVYDWTGFQSVLRSHRDTRTVGLAVCRANILGQI